MTSQTSGAVDTHRAAAAALRAVEAAHGRVTRAEADLDDAIRAAKATRGVTVEQIGAILGIDRRSVYKRLAR